jgi:hypothetical protein
MIPKFMKYRKDNIFEYVLFYITFFYVWISFFPWYILLIFLVSFSVPNLFFKNNSKFQNNFIRLNIACLILYVFGNISIGLYDHFTPKHTSFYDNNGVLLYKCNYQDKQFDGDYISFFPDGKIQSEGEYSNGKKIGYWRYYSKNGKLIRKTEIIIKREGSICRDGWISRSNGGGGTCSWHGGIRCPNNIHIEMDIK